jgi:hypothetical protein
VVPLYTPSATGVGVFDDAGESLCPGPPAEAEEEVARLSLVFGLSAHKDRRPTKIKIPESSSK